MSANNDGWYVADSEGNTEGPMSRAELEERRLRGAFPSDALAWHLDQSEWRPLAGTSVVAAVVEQAMAAQPSPARAQNAATATGTPGDKAERKRKARAAMAQRAASASVQATPRRESQDSGARLLSHAAQGATVAKVPQMPGKVDPAAAAQSGARAAVAMRRFLARVLDTTTLGLLGAAALWAWVQHEVPGVLGSAAERPPIMLLLIMAVVALVPLETIALTTAGTTPGKALMGLRVLRGGSARPSPVQAWKRAVDVAWRGMALGIPVLSLITSVVAFARFVNSGAMRWDASSGLETHAAPIAGTRWQMALFAALGALFLLSSDFWPDLALQIFGRF